MMTTAMHPEDVKAILRKRYGSIENFALAKGIKSQAVRDMLRGKARGPAAEVAEELGIDPEQLIISSVLVCGTHSNDDTGSHSLNDPVKKALAGAAK